MIRRLCRFFAHLVVHKWYVLAAGVQLGVPLWRLVVHDWTKFLPCEFLPYSYHFYGPGAEERIRDRSTPYTPRPEQVSFLRAWLHHIHSHPHHWQHWIVPGDGTCLPMPDVFVREMIADWIGAGKALGYDDMPDWYRRNRASMKLHPDTRLDVEHLVFLWEKHVAKKA